MTSCQNIGDCIPISPSPTPTPTTPEFTYTPTQTPTKTPNQSPDPTQTQTPTPSITPTHTPTQTQTPTNTNTPTNTQTPTITPTPTQTGAICCAPIITNIVEESTQADCLAGRTKVRIYYSLQIQFHRIFCIFLRILHIIINCFTQKICSLFCVFLLF
jgi:hypothetical protein